jgi:phosphoglycolate phosphatase
MVSGQARPPRPEFSETQSSGSQHGVVKTLLLWDIDGTLIASGGAGMRALRTALQQVFQIDGSLEDIEFAGRTDRWIMRQVFAKFGLTTSEENFRRYFEGYVAALPAELANPNARILPGIAALLAGAAAKEHLVQGLLTGNMRRGAETKLRFHGLWEYFAFGAFADDGEQRNDLGPHAIHRANLHSGHTFSPSRVWVIGDTPHDIACGKAIGACTLAVATGSHSFEALHAHSPTTVLADLSDTTGVLNLFS